MNIRLFLLLVVAVALPARQVDAQIIQNSGDFFVVSGTNIAEKTTVKRLAAESKFTLNPEKIKKRMKKEPTGIPGDTLVLVEFFAGQISYKNDQLEPVILPGKKVQMLPDDFVVFQEYLSSHPGESCYIVAPSMKPRYGFWKTGGTLHLVTNYGVLAPSDMLYQVNKAGDQRLFGYIPLEKVVVYPMTMQRWTGMFGRPNPISLYQTGMVVCDSVSKTIGGKKVPGIKLATDIVSTDKENFFSEIQTSPVRIEYGMMLFVEGEDSPVPSEESPFEGAHYEERDEHSREVQYAYAMQEAPVYVKKIIQPDTLVSENAYMLEVLPKSVESVDSSLSVEQLVSHIVKSEAEKRGLNLAYTKAGTTVSVSWSLILGTAEYVVRFYYGDGTYNTKRVSILSPVVFKNVATGEKCRILITAKDGEGKDIISEEIFFTM